MERKKRETLSARMNIRLTEAEDKRLEKEAVKAGKSVSAYMRSRICTGEKIISAADMNMVLELRDVGARLKQFFDELRQHGASPERKQKHAALLSELAEIVDCIGAKYNKQ